MDSLYIVIPAYNEADNIHRLVEEWYPVVHKHNGDNMSRLVIINDGSKDDTFDLLQAEAEGKPMLTTLTKKNEGHGPTLLYGYSYAVEHEADYIFQTDADGQTNPAEFEQFWNRRKNYSAIIGSRPNREDGASRVFVEKVLLSMLRIVFGVRIPDSNAPFRLMNREVLSKYIRKLPKDFNLPNVMLTTYMVYYKENVKFVDITFRPRQAGNNSMNIQKIAKIGMKALLDFAALRKAM